MTAGFGNVLEMKVSRNNVLALIGAALAAALLSAAPALAADPLPKGNALQGEKLFNQCKVCHALDAGKNGVGPSLKGVIGRQSASVSGYTYSPAMKKSALKWDAQTLSDYLIAPMKKVPGTKMAFAGFAKPQDRADVIAFLTTKK
jgi:cytochrome c